MHKNLDLFHPLLLQWSEQEKTQFCHFLEVWTPWSPLEGSKWGQSHINMLLAPMP